DQCVSPPLVNQVFESVLALDTLPIPPARPDTAWQGREETLSGSKGQTYTGSLRYGDPAQCKIYNAQTNASMDVTYGSDQFGMATLEESVSYEYSCESDPEGDIRCSSAESTVAGWSILHYIDIESAASYRLRADISCQATSNDSGYSLYLHARKLNILFLRYLNQAGEPVDANYCSISDCTVDQIVMPVTKTLNCMAGETVQINQLINFRAPLNAGQKDLISVMSILTPDITVIDITDPAVSEEYGSVGSHTATLDLSASISLQPEP
ncbi:MAG: hypothetical protein KAT61_09350, partial [Gammaproteobacteria bacterium]|nr:hypothetical protein [Gammaproteobacteria bacterium]